jgi:hypothetical protein
MLMMRAGTPRCPRQTEHLAGYANNSTIHNICIEVIGTRLSYERDVK